MKRFTWVAVLMLFSGGVWAQPIINPDNGNYYELVFGEGESWEWEDARGEAAGMTFMEAPGHLVTITSQAEQDFLTDNFSQSFDGRIWLGGTDEGSEGDWRWLTGEPWVYENWAPGQGGPDENCLIFFDSSFEWHDDDCTDGHDYFIVEFEVGGVPTLPMGALIALAFLLLLGALWWLRTVRA